MIEDEIQNGEYESRQILASQIFKELEHNLSLENQDIEVDWRYRRDQDEKRTRTDFREEVTQCIDEMSPLLVQHLCESVDPDFIVTQTVDNDRKVIQLITEAEYLQYLENRKHFISTKEAAPIIHILEGMGIIPEGSDVVSFDIELSGKQVRQQKNILLYIKRLQFVLPKEKYPDVAIQRECELVYILEYGLQWISSNLFSSVGIHGGIYWVEFQNGEDPRFAKTITKKYKEQRLDIQKQIENIGFNIGRRKEKSLLVTEDIALLDTLCALIARNSNHRQ